MTFNDKSDYKNVYGNNLETDSVSTTIPFSLAYLSEDQKRQAQSQANLSIISILITFGTSLIISVLLGGKIEASWLLLGTLQLMSLVPLLNLNLPANFREFSKNLAILHGEPERIPNIFEEFVDSDNLQPFSPYFELMSKLNQLKHTRFQNHFIGYQRR